MFKDIETSKTIREEFFKYCNNTPIQGVEFSTEMLTNGQWPGDDKITCKLPKEMQACVSKFEVYYVGKGQRKKIEWAY